MRKEELFKKTKVFLLAIVTALSVTACSFTTDKAANIAENIIPQLTKSIEQSSFKNSESLAALKDDFKAIEGFKEAVLVRVTDGDTIVVKIDSKECKVRMIGIDTPESVASKEYLKKTGKQNTFEGKTASDYTKALIDIGQTLYLQKDKSDTDKYGRLLRYVWTKVPEDARDISEVSSYMVNALLLKEGVAKPVEYEPDTSYADMFEEIYEER